MNFDLNFTRLPAFVRFKVGIQKAEALEYLFNLCQICQTERTTVLDIPDDITWRLSLGLPPDLMASQVRDCLLSCGFIEQENGSPNLYRITLFEKSNASLIACWANGRKGGRGKDKEADQSNKVTNQ